jgi:hypothetical protein
LFDRGLDGVAKALRWAYGGNRIYLVRDEIGADADDDREIIPYCKKHGVIWVTKDWKTATVDIQVARVKAAGVSVWWIREEERKQMARPAVLFALARDIDRVAFAFETSDQPIRVVSSVGRNARPIEVPFAQRRNAARRLPERPKPRIARPIPLGQRLFPE